jgi:hypothetical protein
MSTFDFVQLDIFFAAGYNGVFNNVVELCEKSLKI